MPINPRSRARDPNAMSISLFAIGSINFGVSPSGVERSASKNRPTGSRAASNPERTAAPLPRFGKFSSKRVSILASFNLSRAIAAVASVDPSLTTINSLSAALDARYSSVRRSVSPMRPASLKQGMTTENGGSIFVVAFVSNAGELANALFIRNPILLAAYQSALQSRRKSQRGCVEILLLRLVFLGRMHGQHVARCLAA